VRFFLDHDVDARLVGFLTKRGHECWTASEANLYDASDDTLTVYADDHQAVLITHDREFSRRRRKNTVGMHIQLRCAEPDALALLSEHLDELVALLNSADGNIFIVLSSAGYDVSRRWD
jgi:predicted nuclease of predicted toxin-antitoxin system